jgi:ribosomal protein S27AE
MSTFMLNGTEYGTETIQFVEHSDRSAISWNFNKSMPVNYIENGRDTPFWEMHLCHEIAHALLMYVGIDSEERAAVKERTPLQNEEKIVATLYIEALAWKLAKSFCHPKFWDDEEAVECLNSYVMHYIYECDCPLFTVTDLTEFNVSTPPTFNRDDGWKEEVGITTPTMDQVRRDTVKDLYRVTSKINDVCLKGYWCDEVTIWWVCPHRDYPIMHPAEGIEDYDNLEGEERFWALDCLNEYFSEEEAKALVQRLSTFKDFTKTQITKVDLPLSEPERVCSFWRTGGTLLPAGWDKDALPFKVTGVYDVDGGAVKREPSVCPPCGKEISCKECHDKYWSEIKKEVTRIVLQKRESEQVMMQGQVLSIRKSGE